MEDFYKDIKDNIDQRPEPSFDEGAWKAMDKKLGRKSRMIPLAYLGWLAIPLALLIGTNIYWYNEASTFQQPTVNTHKTDTLYVYKTTTKVDTVYISNQKNQTKYNFRNPSKVSPSALSDIQNLKSEVNQLRKQLSSVSTAYNTLLNENRKAIATAETQEQKPSEIELLKANKNSVDGITSEGINKSISDENENKQQLETVVEGISKSDNATNTIQNHTSGKQELPVKSNNSEDTKATQASDVLNSKTDLIPVKTEMASEKTSEEHSEETSKAAIVSREDEIETSSAFDKLAKEIASFSIKDIYLGFGSGLYYPQFDTGDYSIGQFFELSALLPLSEHFQAESSLSYNNVRYEGDTTSDVGIEPIDIPFDDVVLSKVEAPIVSYRFDVGMQYAMNTSHKIQPKIGLGYGLQYFSVHEFQYEYEDVATGILLDIEENALLNEFRANSLLFKPGIDYQINDNLLLNLQSVYRSVLGKQDFLSSDFWSVGLSIKYKL